jgi:23S rRNA (guanine745-N1)-methyltransferase
MRRTRNSGDSAEMLRARRIFLDRGHYAPLAAQISRTVESHLTPAPASAPRGHIGDWRETVDILDSGCGEGYYMEQLQAHLAAGVPNTQCRLWGLDSSREAARFTAKRCHAATVVVADCKDALPFATGSLDVLITIFAPRNPAEFARVLAPGGLLLIVVPDHDHLAELRDHVHLLSIEENKLQHVLGSLTGLFTAFDVRALKLALDLSPDDLSLLVTMSPSHRHQPERSPSGLRSQEQYQAAASFQIVTCLRMAPATADLLDPIPHRAED